MTPYQKHKADWKDCTRCPLCEGRSSVVLKRGTIPCAVLFVGEAPGASEDVLGEAFVGPAGHLLDDAINRACDGREITRAFTNLVGCIPLGDDGEKTKEPPLEAIKACRPRLVDFTHIARPKMIVLVGKLSVKHVVREKCYKYIEITHPAAILRADQSQQLIMFQRVVVTLANAFEEL